MEAASPEKSKISSNPGVELPLAGDPACTLCNGLGYLRRDLPVGHPEFGKISICECRHRSVADQVRNRLFSMSHLDELKHLTFETFQARGRLGLGDKQVQSLEWAYNRSTMYASSLKGWLLLMGGYGTGKTHLAAAIANYAVQMGVPTLFLTVPDLLDSLRFAFDSTDTTFEERFEQIRNCELLILDDFGTQIATSWAQEKLFQIINYRYINKLPLVITTNLSMEEIEGRIRSRLQDPSLVDVVHIFAQDYRRPINDGGHSELSSLDMHSNQTLANFLMRSREGLKPDEVKSLEKALKQAHEFAEHPDGWLVFTGPYGCGKTHLAAAIANYRFGSGDPPLFVMVPDLLDHLRATFTPNSATTYDRRFEEVRMAKLLVLDDLGSQSATPWAREKLYQLINYRYNLDLPTVITVAVEMLDQVDERIKTRMRDERICSFVTITAPSFVGVKKKKPSRA